MLYLVGKDQGTQEGSRGEGVGGREPVEKYLWGDSGVLNRKRLLYKANPNKVGGTQRMRTGELWGEVEGGLDKVAVPK